MKRLLGKILGVGTAVLLPMLAGDVLPARTKVTVTAPAGFAEGIKRIALVTPVCAPQLDCPDVIKRVTGTIQAELDLELVIVPDARVRDELFKKGATDFTPEHREELANALELDAFLEIDVLFANRGDGYGGRKGSESKVAVRLVKPTGEILMSGSGFGRPMNVVTSPERVADRTVKEILERAFPKK